MSRTSMSDINRLIDILMIGPAGVGKTSTLNTICDTKFQISDSVHDCTESMQSGEKVCNGFTLRFNDSPGYSDQIALDWWKEIGQKSYTMVIFFLNGTDIKISNNPQLINMIKFCHDTSFPFLIVAINDAKISLKEFGYDYYLLKDPGRQEQLQRNSAAIIGYTELKLKIIELSSINGEPRTSLPFLSPAKIIEKLAIMQLEYGKRTNELRNKQIEISEIQTKLIQVSTQLTIREQDLSQQENRNKIINEEIANSKVELSKIRSELKESLKRLTDIQHVMNNWINRMVSTDETGNVYTKGPNKAWHIVTWLPFAGEFSQYLHRKDMDEVFKLAMEMKTFIDTAVKSHSI